MKANNTVEAQAVKKNSALRENIEAIIIAVILAIFIRTFIVQAFKIPSGSMKETLKIGDHILVNKFIYGVRLPYFRNLLMPLKKPERGDIVVFIFPEDNSKDFIKRVIGVEGDTIEIRNKKVFVNNHPVEHDYGIYLDTKPGSMPVPSVRDNMRPLKVPANSLFVMGDNRDHSYDSRFWGVVDLQAVKGKAFMIYFSWDKENFGVRWKRFFKIIR